MENLFDDIFEDIVEDDVFVSLIERITSQTPGLLCQIVTYDGQTVPKEPSFSIPSIHQDVFLKNAKTQRVAHFFDLEDDQLFFALNYSKQSAVVVVLLPNVKNEKIDESHFLKLMENTIQLGISTLEADEDRLEKKQLANQIDVLNRQHSQLVEDNHQQYLQLREQEKQYAKQLEEEISKQTRELRQANLDLLKASRLKNEFLANMSHELRTPTNAIIGFAGLLSSTALTEEQKEYVQTLITSGEGLLVLINEILDLAKIEAGKLELEEIPFKLEPILQGAIALLKSQAAEKKNQIILEIEHGTPEHVIADQNRLRQVLINLLGNANKFTENGEITLRVVSRSGDTTDLNYVNFLIQDTGIGIPPEKQAKVFEKFTQADGSTTRKYGGTGLGLSICNQLVGLMHGEIKLESEVGVGSTFSFEIPLRLAEKEKSVKTAKPAQESQKEQLEPVSHDRTILIVEDNPVNQRLATIMVKKQGFEVIVAGDGLEALSALKENQIDLVLMDIQMPNMDGITATKKIREIESSEEKKNYIALASRFDAIPIIALSAHVREEDKREGREAGMDDFLTKPIIKAKLEATLNKIV